MEDIKVIEGKMTERRKKEEEGKIRGRRKGKVEKDR